MKKPVKVTLFEKMIGYLQLPIGLRLDQIEHEKSVCSLAACIGDMQKAEALGKQYTTSQVRDITYYAAQGIALDSAVFIAVECGRL